MHNKWRNKWELREALMKPENAHQFVFRELFEQIKPCFQGPERIEYGALFRGELYNLMILFENDQSSSIILLRWYISDW